MAIFHSYVKLPDGKNMVESLKGHQFCWLLRWSPPAGPFLQQGMGEERGELRGDLLGRGDDVRGAVTHFGG